MRTFAPSYNIPRNYSAGINFSLGICYIFKIKKNLYSSILKSNQNTFVGYATAISAHITYVWIRKFHMNRLKLIIIS